jgi:RNA polymerase sigma-70 factor, ECF subfamily
MMRVVRETAEHVESSKRERFDALFRTHRERSHRLAWRLLGGDEQGARDVVQNAFAKAWRGFDGFRDEALLATWLTRIVIHEASNHRRWRRVRARLSPFVRQPQQPVDEGDPLLRRRIRDAVDRLSDGQREVFVLVHLEGRSVTETAELLGKAEGTVKSHLHRAFETVRSELADLERP